MVVELVSDMYLQHLLWYNPHIYLSHPPFLYFSHVSLESPLSPPNVSIPTPSPRPETTIPSTITLVEPYISLDLPFLPHVTFTQTFSPPLPSLPQPSISLDAPPPVIKSIAPLSVIKSFAPQPFLKGTSHAARLHVRVTKGHQVPCVRRVLTSSVSSDSTTHVDGMSQSIEMETFQIT